MITFILATTLFVQVTNVMPPRPKLDYETVINNINGLRLMLDMDEQYIKTLQDLITKQALEIQKLKSEQDK